MMLFLVLLNKISLQIAKNKVPTELGLKLGKDYNDPDWDK